MLFGNLLQFIYIYVKFVDDKNQISIFMRMILKITMVRTRFRGKFLFV